MSWLTESSSIMMGRAQNRSVHMSQERTGTVLSPSTPSRTHSQLDHASHRPHSQWPHLPQTTPNDLTFYLHHLTKVPWYWGSIKGLIHVSGQRTVREQLPKRPSADNQVQKPLRGISYSNHNISPEVRQPRGTSRLEAQGVDGLKYQSGPFQVIWFVTRLSKLPFLRDELQIIKLSSQTLILISCVFF